MVQPIQDAMSGFKSHLSVSSKAHLFLLAAALAAGATVVIYTAWSLHLARARILILEQHLGYLYTANRTEIQRLIEDPAVIRSHKLLEATIPSLTAKYEPLQKLTYENDILKSAVRTQAVEYAHLMGMVIHETNIPPSQFLSRQVLKILAPNLYPDVDAAVERFVAGADEDQVYREFNIHPKHPYFQYLLRQRGITRGLLPADAQVPSDAQ
jgi:hypothetical protein